MKRPNHVQSPKSGSVAKRRRWIKKWDADFIREQLNIPGCRALLCLDKEVRHAGERTLREVHEKCMADSRTTAKRLGLKN